MCPTYTPHSYIPHSPAAPFTGQWTSDSLAPARIPPFKSLCTHISTYSRFRTPPAS